MANTVPLEAYIPAGCLIVSVGEQLAANEELWSSVQQHDGWLMSRHHDDAGHLLENSLPAPIQKLLLKLPIFSALVRPFLRQWVRFSFCASRSGPSRGVCRVYVLPDDEYRRLVPRSDLKLRRDLHLLLNSLDYSAESWRGEYDEHRPRTTVHAARSSGGGSQNSEDAESEISLLQMFNTIPSPNPQPELIRDGSYQRVMDSLAASKIHGLKSTLYSYQIRSAAVMLQRELHPGRVIDPRLLRIADQNGRDWYYDDVNGEVLREPRFYDGVSGGILAEEMGTGKTLICLALILATRCFPAEIPEVCRDFEDGIGGNGVRRPRIGSLADMAATVIARQSVPWKLYLEDTAADAAEYRNCIDIIRRNPAQYVLPRFKVTRENSRSPQAQEKSAAVTLSSCSLVIVPANLVRQWQQEIEKHTEGLKVLVVADKKHFVPSLAEILEADILLFSIPRFEKLEQDRVITRSGWEFHSPLASVHFKRVIVDEGHRLGNSKIGRKSNLLLVLDCLQVSARWIVTGTPSTGLIGVDDSASSTPNSEASDADRAPPRADALVSRIKKTMVESKKLAISSSAQEKTDLERIGSMASLYLRVRPWANTVLENSDTPADWAVYVMQPNHSNRSSGRRDCLRATLDSLIIRHRTSEVGDLLPAVVEKVVLLDGSFQDKLCLNLFSMMIIFNAVQSQRTDQDYFFHPTQRGALLQLLSNIRQSTFFGSYFYSAEEIAKAIETAEKFLQDKKVSTSEDDERLLRTAIAFGRMAKENKFKALADRYHEVPVYVEDFPGGGDFAPAWSIDVDHGEGTTAATGDNDEDRLTCTAAPMVRALQQFLRPCIDAPHSLRAMFNSGRFVEMGHETLLRQQQQQEEQSSSKPKGPRPKPAPTLAGNTKLGEDSSPLKRRAGSLGTPARMSGIPAPSDVPETEIAAPLAGARIVSTSSAKLSYLIDSIVAHQDGEQIIVFYDNENVAFYLAEHLEVLQIHHLIYARGITAERRAQYVATFNHNAKFRVLLMDISQAAFGLDMQAASRIYFISPVLNPQVEAQAIGRARRIGQKRAVSVETLVLRDSVEEVIVARRQALTQAELRKIKSILDDRPIYEWMANARIIPLPGQDAAVHGSAQMAPLQTPQFLFGRGFGRVEHPDEGLVAVERPAPTPTPTAMPVRGAAGSSEEKMSDAQKEEAAAAAAAAPEKRTHASTADENANGEVSNGVDVDEARPPSKKLKLPRAQVRFA